MPPMIAARHDHQEHAEQEAVGEVRQPQRDLREGDSRRHAGDRQDQKAVNLGRLRQAKQNDAAR